MEVKSFFIPMGNVQFLISFITVWYTRWRLEPNSTLEKLMKKFVKLYLHSSIQTPFILTKFSERK